MSNWYKKSFRRNLIDIIVEDWDEEFLSKLDPRIYVDILKKGQIQSAMVYAMSFTGLSYWTTKVGQMHRGLKGRDFFGEVTKLFHKEGMDVVAYYPLIFVNLVYDKHPEWRMKTSGGKYSKDFKGLSLYDGRLGMCCPNNLEYRNWVVQQLDELINAYEFEGFFFDMCFWPIHCYCDSCKERYRKEVGKEIPTVIDWSDNNWVTFAYKRDDWLIEFEKFLYKTVKDRKPELTVEINCSVLFFSYLTDRIMDALDFNSGDFYGGPLTQNYMNKAFNSISPNLPFEFITGREYPHTFMSTTTKPKEMLALEIYLALANGAAFLFNNGIHIDGTLDPKPYERFNEIFGESKKYEPFMGGNLCSDVAVYSSINSMVDMATNGKTTEEYISYISTNLNIDTIFKNLQPSISAARILKENHIPFTTITKRCLNDLGKYQSVVLSGILRMDKEEEDLLQKWVKEGGKLYISGSVPLDIISKLLNLTFEGTIIEYFSYLYPTEKGRFLIEGTMNENDPVMAAQLQLLKVKMKGNADILATIGLPYNSKFDKTKLADLWKSSPGVNTDFPAIIHCRYGKGEVIWSAACLEALDRGYEVQNKMFALLVKKLTNKPCKFTSNASPYIDITLYDQPDKNRYLVNLVNIQESIPIIPISDVDVSVRIDNKKVEKICLLPDEKELDFKVEGAYVRFKVDKLHIYKAVLVYYE